MAQTKHTPGHWAITQEGATRIRINNAKGGVVCDVRKSDLDAARLIAAAPELLKALEGLVSQDEANRPDGATLLDCDAAYKAIARAKGEV